jgi:hypothetical protein
MPKTKPKKNYDTILPPGDQAPAPIARRKPDGTWAKGYSGSLGTDAARARRALNADTITAMHDAFRRGGRQAIDKVMRQQPAIFLKMLVLLVPRELEVTHAGGVKAMSDEQIEAAIEAIKAMLAAKEAKVINGVAEPTPPALPPPAPAKKRGRPRKAQPTQDVVSDASNPGAK